MGEEREREEREEIPEKKEKKKKTKHKKTKKKKGEATKPNEAENASTGEPRHDANAAAAAAAVENPSKKRKRKDVFPYGNYRSYYGYRIGRGTDEDPRLKVMRKEWFHGRDCLDIGCNSGIITTQIAHKFGCRSILGVDIDSERIEDAYRHLKKFTRENNASKTGIDTSRSEVSEKVQHASPNASGERRDVASHDLPSEERDLFDIVSFKRENFVQSSYPPQKQYDTILCLSVTKWIHLNWGDEGLITLFSKIWKLLKQGGILVLEPQPWKSYESNRSVSEATSMHFRSIEFRPESFQEILLDKIGFRCVEDVTSSLSGSKLGFDRPIFVFQK